MEKRDYIWVAIRIFGIYLLVNATMAIPAVASALLQIYNTGDILLLTDDMAYLRSQVRAAALTTLLQSVLGVVIYGIVGMYLAFRGKLVYRWICPPEESKV
jgi:hypothetical protein